MICALVLAIAVAGQTPRIDFNYGPKANDRALLGAWNVASPEEMVQRASCYLTLNDARAAIDAMGETVGDGGLSAKPDAYSPMAGTAIEVKEVTFIEISKAGIRPKFSVIKVKLLEGTFKGKELYTASHSVFRYLDQKAARKDPELIRPAAPR